MAEIEKGIFDRLGTWSENDWVVLEATRQIGRCWLSLILMAHCTQVLVASFF